MQPLRAVRARAICGGITVIEHELKAVRYLRQEVPEDWDRAADAAGLLAETGRYLPWSDRADAFDAFFWTEAKRRLASDDITAIVNRQAALLSEPVRIEAYATFCGAVTAAALLQLDEPLRVEDEAAALIHFFARSEPHREAALAWIGDGHHLNLASRLPAWPGCAFLLLILSPSDSAESFLARDAFWAAMLGQS